MFYITLPNKTNRNFFHTSDGYSFLSLNQRQQVPKAPLEPFQTFLNFTLAFHILEPLLTTCFGLSPAFTK